MNFHLYIQLIFAVLQPVPNEYNINERIKEANQELYSTPHQDTDAANRKVRFRENLEDFEPEESDEEHTEKNSSQSSASNPKPKEEIIIDEIDQENDELNIEEIDQILSKSNEDMDYTGDDVSEICEQIEDLKAKSDDDTDKLDEDEIHSQRSSKSDLTVEELEDPESQPKVVHLCCEDHKTKKSNCIQKCFPKKITKKCGKVNPSNSDEESRDKKNKTCCQHKHSDEYIQKLPRYNGQNSVYGLSQEQLQKRELNLQKSVHLKQLKGNENVL